MTVNKTLTADQARDILEKVALFDDLEPEEKEILSLFNWCFVVYQPGDHLTNEDSLDKRFFVLMSGLANIYKGDPPQLITQLKAGEIIGEISFLTNEPRTASVIAAAKCSALVVDQALLEKLPISLREKLKDQIILKMAQRLNRMNNRLTLGHL
ncbi:Crp/Fnr family transcriptional regulator [Neptuniibacter sp.]|uniref:Crp/Fnr family transcriptional regulator n=1 Tax=Neptuniibacter sp. TaxID=1962643 RepID=UPI002603D1A1|nr:cyclic nucleotide-binding domain-containing protein [Neptuniibacter sp.]MCP4597599.1 cyclic nucleotide-binding domain-containing protein [Neptuniibacter sp.]